MLKFTLNPDSFIRAAVLRIRDRVDIIAADEGGLWTASAISADEDAATRRYNQLLLEEPHGQSLSESRVRNLVFFGLRHSSRPWAALTAGLAELLAQGSDYLLAGAGPGSRKVLALRRTVVRELHRLTGFTRLTPAGDIMVGEAPLVHNSGDLLALGLARRNPGQPLVLLTPQGDWLAVKGRAMPVDGSPFRLKLQEDNFSQAWLTYYRSQFIESRNNPCHAARAIPQEYWQWLAEGAELARARAAQP